jgi:hypothetical protein
MQLQVECNNLVGKRQVCWMCDRPFKMQAARVILCDNQGRTYGDVCPTCIGQGYGWLSSQFERLTAPQKTAIAATLTPIAGMDRAIAHTKSA